MQDKAHNVLAGAKKEQLQRRTITFEYEAEVVRHKIAEKLKYTDCAEKFGVLPELVKDGEKQYEAGQLIAAAARNTVRPKQVRSAVRAQSYRASRWKWLF